MRRWLLLVTLLFPLNAHSATKPNVVFLFADDLGWGDVSFNGRKEWRTEHLDKLASQGTNFQRWYTAAVVCAPSRAALMTGKYGIHNGVSGNSDDLPQNAVTLADALKKQGYATAMFGKWHHGRTRPGAKSYRHPLDLGFDEFMGYTSAVHAWEHFPKELWFGREMKPVPRGGEGQGGGGPKVPTLETERPLFSPRGAYSPKLLADQAIDFLKRKKDEPFFLYLPFIEPHLLIEAPDEDVAEFEGKFTDRDEPLGAAKMLTTKPLRGSFLRQLEVLAKDKKKDRKSYLRACYAAMITRLDREIGRILRTLDELKLSDNTIVVFTSDHGATFEVGNLGASAYHDSNHPFRGQKRTLWEGGIRVPAIVRWPGKVPAGKKSQEIVQMIDVFPTLLAAAGGKPDPAWKIDGKNLLDVWRGKASSPKRTLFWEWRSEGYHQLAAMRGNLKLVITGNATLVSGRDGTSLATLEMFDVVHDPGERRNVLHEHRALANDLRKQLNAWLATETEESKWGKPQPKK